MAVLHSDTTTSDTQQQDDEVRVRRSPVSTASSSEHWVEVALVADPSMLEYHGAHELEAYLFTLMNMVSTSQLYTEYDIVYYIISVLITADIVRMWDNSTDI